MKKFTWLTTEKRTNTEEITPANIINLMKLNDFNFNYSHDNYNYFKRDNAEGFVTTRNDGEDVLCLFIKGVKYSVLLPISQMKKFFITGRSRSEAVNVYVNVFGYDQTFSTK